MGKTDFFTIYTNVFLLTYKLEELYISVSGQDEVIKLIHPTQLVMFGTLNGHKGYVSSLVFHPDRPNILFSKFILDYHIHFSCISDRVFCRFHRS